MVTTLNQKHISIAWVRIEYSLISDSNAIIKRDMNRDAIYGVVELFWGWTTGCRRILSSSNKFNYGQFDTFNSFARYDCQVACLSYLFSHVELSDWGKSQENWSQGSLLRNCHWANMSLADVRVFIRLKRQGIGNRHWLNVTTYTNQPIFSSSPTTH